MDSLQRNQSRIGNRVFTIVILQSDKRTKFGYVDPAGLHGYNFMIGMPARLPREGACGAERTCACAVYAEVCIVLHKQILHFRSDLGKCSGVGLHAGVIKRIFQPAGVLIYDAMRMASDFTRKRFNAAAMGRAAPVGVVLPAGVLLAKPPQFGEKSDITRHDGGGPEGAGIFGDCNILL